MATIQGAIPRDANGVPITTTGCEVYKSLNIDASNTTKQSPIFTVTGSVEVLGLWGIVTTALSSNITAAFWQFNDQTATPDISLATGTTLSSFAVGSLLTRKSLVSVALTGNNASAAAVVDPVAATAPGYFMPFALVQKTAGVLSQIEFVYTSTNTPATGVIKFGVRWLPLSEDGNVVAV
ncbi:MAG: hypothetical protein WC047_08455 [Kiritimatiellales bacterium]